MNFGLNSKTAFHAHVVSSSSCSVTADVIDKEARKIAAFVSFFWPHPYSTQILGVFPLHQAARVGVSESRDPKLFGRAIIFEVFQPVWKSYLNVTDGQTTCNLITALCIALHGKNYLYVICNWAHSMYTYMKGLYTRIRSVERGICPIAAVCTVQYCSIVQTLSLKYPGHDFDLEVTWRRWSPDHTIGYVQFPIRALSELTEIWSPYTV